MPKISPPSTFRTSAVVAACCAVNVAVLMVLRIWHPSPFGLGADFNSEAYSPYVTLAHGHVLRFVETAPSYMGSMIMRAPFALIPIWLGSSQMTVCFWASLPGVLAPSLLGLWLVHRSGQGVQARHLPLLLATVNPITLYCLSFGHPEDLIAACLAIAAVICAAEQQPRAAGVLVALAIAAKPWAAVAAPVVFAIAPIPRLVRREFLVVSGLFWIPFLLVREFAGGSAGAAGAVTAQVGSIFNPADLLWWLGPDSWFVRNAHPLIVLAACVGAYLWRRLTHDIPAQQRTHEGLHLLALMFLIRFAFDPWDTVYYALPLLLTLMVADRSRLPILPVVLSVVLCLATAPGLILSHPQAQAPTIFAAVAVPLLLALVGRTALADRRRAQAATPAAPASALA